jgi:hypothetical protein
MNKRITISLLILISLAIAAYFITRESKSSIKKELKDFAVKDTAAITKIFMADTEGKQVLLERLNETDWQVNGKYLARKDAINLLLTTIRRITVKKPVNKPMFETIIKQLATKSTKVEIYLNNEDKPYKVYYVGGPDKDYQGSFMLLENSSVPFVTHIEGFRGFPSARYFTDENAWRRKEVFTYKPQEIAKIIVERYEEPEKSFSIVHSNGTVQLFDYQNKPFSSFDTITVYQYINNYRSIHYENFEESKPESYQDSLIKTDKPILKYTVITTEGKERSIALYNKPMKPGAVDYNGQPIKYDVDRMYGLTDDSLFVVVQHYVFDKLDVPVDVFQPQK